MTLAEQIADIDAQIAAASKARSVRDGDKSIDRQSLTDLQALRARLVQRQTTAAGRRSCMTFIQIEDD